MFDTVLLNIKKSRELSEEGAELAKNAYVFEKNKALKAKLLDNYFKQLDNIKSLKEQEENITNTFNQIEDSLLNGANSLIEKEKETDKRWKRKRGTKWARTRTIKTSINKKSLNKKRHLNKQENQILTNN